MDTNGERLQVSASDLAKHLACRHLTSLDLKAARGEIKRVYRDDPSLAVLAERGFRHEAAYLSHLKEHGVEVLDSHESGEVKGIQGTFGRDEVCASVRPVSVIKRYDV